MSKTSPPVKPDFAPSPNSSTSPNSTTSPISPGNLFFKGIDVTNMPYTTSYLRTTPISLPFPHPKWHIRPSKPNNREVEVYETMSPLFEEYDPVSGYMGSVGAVLESVETDYVFDAGDSGIGELGGVDEDENEGARDEREDSALGDMDEFQEQRFAGWMGYVRFRESAVRSSIKRERDADGERADEGAPGGRKSKRARGRR